MAGAPLLYSSTSWGEPLKEGYVQWNSAVSGVSVTTTGLAKSTSLTLSKLVESRTGYRLVSDQENRNFADVLQRIQQHTQLEWSEVARTLGVSRRTVYNWLSGTRVSGANAKRLAAFYNAAMKELIGVERKNARAYLLAPQGQGATALARITQYLREHYKRPTGYVRASELMQPARVPDEPSMTGGFDVGIEIPELDDFGFPVSN